MDRVFDRGQSCAARIPLDRLGTTFAWPTTSVENTRCWTCRRRSIRASITAIAHEKEVHPVRDYLNGVSWDGVERVGGWLSTYLGVPDSEYARLVGMWWLISGVARILNRGAKSTIR